MKKFLLSAFALAVAISASAFNLAPAKNHAPINAQKCSMALDQQISNQFKGIKTMPTVPVRASEEDLVTVPDGVTIETDWTINGIYNTQEANSIETATSVAIDGNDVYIQGLAYYFPDAWVKGTMSGTTVTFPVQYVGTDSYGEEYLGGYSSSGPTSYTFTYDASENSFTLTSYLIEYDGNTSSAQMWGYYSSLKVVKGEIVKPDLVTPPDGLETEDFTFFAYAAEDVDNEGNITWEEEETQLDIKIGEANDVVYIQGLCKYLPEAWVIASFNEDGELVIPTGQYLGAVNNVYDIYLLGYGENSIEDIVFTYSEEYGCYITDHLVILSSKANAISWYEIYGGGAIGQFVDEAMYLLGTFNNWNEESPVALVQGEDGLWTVTQAMDAGAEFKFKDESGNWYGGQDANNVGYYGITEEMVDGETAIPLVDGANFKIPVAGTWTFTVNKENMTMVISGQWVTPIDDVYILGQVNGNDWAPNVGVKMATEDGVEYTAEVTCAPLNDQDTDGYSYFSFTTKLAENATDWNAIANFRMGAESNDYEITDALMGTELTLTAGQNAFKIADGNYNFALNLDNMKLVITKKATPAVTGDVTGDGVADIDDVNAIINIILKVKTVDDYPGVADLNEDGQVDVDDMNIVINIILTQNN